MYETSFRDSYTFQNSKAITSLDLERIKLVMDLDPDTVVDCHY
jgi:hypothetical protein